MRLRECPIGDLVDKCQTWNPKANGAGSFHYIDLSSVDKETKSIASIERHECSEAPSRARQLVKAGDVLVATVRPNLNGVALLESAHDGMTASTGYCVLRPNKDKLDSRFLFHWVKTGVFVQRMVDVATGANYPAVSDAKVKASAIPLPPLAEQKRIAAILDAADTLRAKRRQSLAELDTLLQSTFLELFGDPVTNPKGWEEVNFEDIVFFQEGPGVRKWQFRDEGIKLINVRNVVEGQLVLENTDRHLDPDEVALKYQHFLLNEGDLVMSSSGVTWGKIAYVKSKHLPLCLNTSMIRLRPRGSDITHSFIRAFIESESFRRQILKLITGSAQPNFGPSHLKQIEIGLPPIDLQHQFAQIVESVEQQKARLRAHLAELDTLFASLQSRAFNGEL